MIIVTDIQFAGEGLVFQVGFSLKSAVYCHEASSNHHVMLINAVCSLQCGVADGEGFLSIWQVNQTTSNPKPYLVSKQGFFIVIIIVEESKIFET